MKFEIQKCGVFSDFVFYGILQNQEHRNTKQRNAKNRNSGTLAEHRNTGGTTEYHGTAEQRNNKTTQQEILPMQNNDILSRYHN